VLDDGDLGRVRRVLRRLRLDFEHWMGCESGEGIERPRDLLITNARCAQAMPVLESGDDESCEPIWVCAHSQDFLPLRERLRALGVHYLIHSRLDAELLRLFFVQLLHRGAERRGRHRLPIDCELRYRLGEAHGRGRLAELSRAGCRLLASEAVAIGAPATLYLPPELSRGRELEVSGRVTHCSAESGRSGDGGEGCSVIVEFSDVDDAASAQLGAILEGRDLGTRITPLAAVPERAKRGMAPVVWTVEETELVDENRRAHPRREYLSELAAMGADGSAILFGRDLSLSGLRVGPHPRLSVGSHVSIALYGRSREEPLLIDAEVLREDPGGGFGLRFGPMEPQQQAWLERLLQQLPEVEALGNAGLDSDRIVISRLVRSESP
jgi:hypothetical protein